MTHIDPRAYETEAEVVVKNAMRQKRRGRRPGMPYKDIKNPQRALVQAQKDLEVYTPGEPEEHEWIPTTVANMIRIARFTGKPCTTKLLIGDYTAFPTSSFYHDMSRLFDVVFDLCDEHDGTDNIRRTNEPLGVFVQQNILRAMADELF